MLICSMYLQPATQYISHKVLFSRSKGFKVLAGAQSGLLPATYMSSPLEISTARCTYIWHSSRVLHPWAFLNRSVMTSMGVSGCPVAWRLL